MARFILRIGKLEEMLKGLDKEVDIFKMKEKLTLEEIKYNVEKLNKIAVSMEATVKEIEVCVWYYHSFTKPNELMICLPGSNAKQIKHI